MDKLRPLSLFAFFLALVVVVLGAYTRLVDAGLGCPDWPTCYGHLWIPDSPEEIQRANAQFQETPVETDKTWPEQVHRIFASSLGMVILILFGLSMRKAYHNPRAKLSIGLLLSALVGGTVLRMFTGDFLDVWLLALVLVYFANLFRLRHVVLHDHYPIKLIAALAGLVVLQGLFGMWTVTLKLWPKVVTAHLLGGFATLSVLWLVINRLHQWSWVGLEGNGRVVILRRVAVLTLGMVIIQVALGGWTSSNYAALACPDFPLCQNQWVPEADFAEGFNVLQTIGPNYLGGLLDNQARIAIHIAHRIGAIGVTLLVATLGLLMLRWLGVGARRYAAGLLAVLAVQLSLGILNIVMALPLWIAVMHNAGGALLLLTLVTIVHRLYTMPAEFMIKEGHYA